MHRLFIAVELSITVVERLAMLQKDLEVRIDQEFGDQVRLRTVDVPNIHITLKFIGDTAPEMVPRIQEVLSELCKPLFPFEVECRDVGVFPKPSRPRILWAGLDEKSAEVLGLLQKTIEHDLFETLAIEKESRSFSPHVTVARVKSRTAPSFKELLQRYDDVSFGESFIKDIVLYESHLDEDGPRYEIVERFVLGD